MLKQLFLGILFSLFFTNFASAEELKLVKDKVYILNFDEEIQNMHSGGSWVEAQILHMLSEDKKQVILSLKAEKEGFLQVKTEKKFYNYKITPSDKSSSELLKIDYPPIENLDVDVYTGD